MSDEARLPAQAASRPLNGEAARETIPIQPEPVRRTFFKTILGLLMLPFGAKAAGDTNPGQPRPILTKLVQIRVGHRWASAILRRWRPGDTARCKLCDPGKCSAFGNCCLIGVDQLIKASEAPNYSTVGERWQDELKRTEI